MNHLTSSRSRAEFTRRGWLKKSAALAGTGLASLPCSSTQAETGQVNQAQIAITLDLEMSRNFPTWESRHWDYEKGNLNAETKQYTEKAASRVREFGGVLHGFVVGRVLEQENVDWLKRLSDDGHPLGNHTYDHVNVRATQPKDVQFRFQRAPWLMRNQSVTDSIRENIALCEAAMQLRLGKKSDGFRTPGGFYDGLKKFPQIRAMLRELGFNWVSSLYPHHPYTKPMEQPSKRVVEGIVAAQKSAQPFTYPCGLIEIPMSPISDIGAFRTGRWKLEWFLDTIRESLQWAIDQRMVFDFLAHPSCLYVVDPEFRTIDMICEMVADAGDNASIVSLDKIAASISGAHP
ncbi:MAG: polysaccharide deacetylase family protein [Fuerstiella sp.]|nr:polysaccharide deacetylase family protein [Fuerstiella sp.]